MGGTIHCKMTRVEDVSLGQDKMDLAGGVLGAGRGRGAVWAPRGSTTGRAAKGRIGMYQVDKLGETARLPGTGLNHSGAAGGWNRDNQFQH